jgi:hypothetical protein
VRKLIKKTGEVLAKPRTVRRINVGPLVEDNMSVLALELHRLRMKAEEGPLDHQDIVKFEKLSKVLATINREDREDRKQDRLDQMSDAELLRIIEAEGETVDE